MAYFLVALGLVAGAVLWHLTLEWNRKQQIKEQERKKLDEEVKELMCRHHYRQPKNNSEHQLNYKHVNDLKNMVSRLHADYK